MPFMTWVKTPDGYKPVEITDEEMVAQNTVKRAEREKMERIREQLEIMGDMEREKMEFDKSRVYTSLNADELKAGDKVIVADTIATLTLLVRETTDSMELAVLQTIGEDNEMARFKTSTGEWCLAYLMERKENCTNCGSTCGYADENHHALQCSRCDNWQPKAEPKTEPHYRPFRDTDELIEKWWKLDGWSNAEAKYKNDKLRMPLIWVRNKSDRKVWLITEFDNRILDYLFTNCEFLDGSICGVEE